MDNQHRHIKGYRDLDEAEIALMNEVKGAAEQIGQLVERVAKNPGTDQRWASIAKTGLQQGFMALVRSVAKPESF